MKLSPLVRLLLALAFVAGQFCALAHATQHELTPDKAQNCETCALAHGGMAPPMVLPLHCSPVPVSLTPDATRPDTPALRPTSRPRSRAPPMFPS